MPFWRAFYHLVWATKNRELLITPGVEPHLHAYMVHKAAEMGVFVYAIGGWPDHVHLIVGIPPHVSVADLVKSLKGSSSHDMNLQAPDTPFAWQRGYGVLTLGQRQRRDAEAYVRNQEEHHRAGTAVAWLERCAETDDGPEDLPVPAASEGVPRLHESGLGYEMPDEPAF